MSTYKVWLHKARNDIKSSKKLLDGDDPIMDTAIYHTQQCAEKALKAYLAYKEQELQKSHDLEFLVECCIKIDSSFEALYVYSEKLTPYATAFRYPDIDLEPDYDDVEDAIVMAIKILNFVETKLS